ncbi:MAG TPA: DUF2520 domain-containing protein [Candidatus Binatia bacterium]|nr:DUF2520 domain-containing protein [Candidatus Binatia bacterium]
MRIWDAIEPEPPEPSEEALAELEAAGIDLDPAGPGRRRPAEEDGDAEAPPGHHRHGDLVHPSDHTHPHRRSAPGERPFIGIVGAGAVGTALGVALSRAGWPVVAVASRDPGRRARFVELVGGARAFAEAQAVLDEVEIVVLCVPDDAVPALAGSLRLYSGQAIVHTSGALGPEVLEPARAAGTQAGTFHPLVAFTEVERSVEALRGATIAIEADPDLAGLLAEMAESLGAVPVRLPPGSQAAYHAAAVLAAGGLVGLLDGIVELGRVAGLDEAGALAVYGRLAEQTLSNVRALGIEAALTGPIVRGDVGTLRRHLEALGRHAPEVVGLYRVLAEREIGVAVRRGALDGELAARLREVLAEVGGPG